MVRGRALRRAESRAEKAERIVQEELARRGWKEDDLSRRKKGDPAKVRVAHRLREETMVTWGGSPRGCIWAAWLIGITGCTCSGRENRSRRE